MYDSPIEEVCIVRNIIDRVATKIAEDTDNAVCTAVVKAGFNIDKEKLTQALAQDKRRYEEAYSKGYSKGREDRDKQIVRCKDCINRPTRENEKATGFALEFPNYWCPCQCADGYYSWYPKDDWYCPYGKRREDEDDE